MEEFLSTDVIGDFEEAVDLFGGSLILLII